MSCKEPISTVALQGLLMTLKLMKPSTRRFSILDDVSAIIPPSRMTLLLGPPGSGKSTLLAALAGKLQSTNLRVSNLLISQQINTHEHGVHTIQYHIHALQEGIYLDTHDVQLMCCDVSHVV